MGYERTVSESEVKRSNPPRRNDYTDDVIMMKAKVPHLPSKT